MSLSKESSELTDSDWLKKTVWGSMNMFMFDHGLKMKNADDFTKAKQMLGAIRQKYEEEKASRAQKFTGTQFASQQEQASGAVSRSASGRIRGGDTEDGINPSAGCGDIEYWWSSY